MDFLEKVKHFFEFGVWNLEFGVILYGKNLPPGGEGAPKGRMRNGDVF
jgi:hypothetical protein